MRLQLVLIAVMTIVVMTIVVMTIAVMTIAVMTIAVMIATQQRQIPRMIPRMIPKMIPRMVRRLIPRLIWVQGHSQMHVCTTQGPRASRTITRFPRVARCSDSATARCR